MKHHDISAGVLELLNSSGIMSWYALEHRLAYRGINTCGKLKDILDTMTSANWIKTCHTEDDRPANYDITNIGKEIVDNLCWYVEYWRGNQVYTDGPYDWDEAFMRMREAQACGYMNISMTTGREHEYRS